MSNEISHKTLDELINDYASIEKKTVVNKNQNRGKSKKYKILIVIALISIILNGVFISLYIIEKTKNDNLSANLELCDESVPGKTYNAIDGTFSERGRTYKVK